ncbi:hypothetical protein Emag_003504 [Eimeria magna]
MDYLKQFFKSAFSKYVEVVHDDMISFGYEKGLEIHDLRLNTKVINDALQASQSEARLECGRIGRMNLVYTPLPGIVTLVHPCRIPRAPPIVRRAKFVGALPATSPHFQRPVRGGTCESLQSCLLQGLAMRPSNLNLESLCPDLSMLSNSIASSCGATHARVYEGCEEIKNLLSNCVESVVSLTPPEYDQLDQIKLPSLRVRTSEIWREALQQRAQRAATGGERPTASAAVHFAQSSAMPQQSAGAMHATVEAAAASEKAAVAAADPGKESQPPLTNNIRPCMQNAPVCSLPAKTTHAPFGASFMPPPQQLSFGILPQTFHQQTAATGCPYTLPTGGGPFPSALHAGVWGPPSAAAVTRAAGPLSSMQGPASPSSLARSYLQTPNAFGLSQQMNHRLNGANCGLGLAAVNPPSFTKGMPPDK